MSNYAGWAMEAPIVAPAWPSATSALITELLPLTSLDLRQGVNKTFLATTDEQFTGFSDADLLNRFPGASGSMPLRYGGLEALFVCALGLQPRRLGATVFPEEISQGIYRSVFEIDPVLSAMAPWDLVNDGIEAGDLTAVTQRKVRRGTLAAHRDTVGVWELLSCMLSQLSLAWGPDGCTLSFEALAYSLDTAPTVNTPVTMRRAMPNAYPDVQFWETVIRLAPFSASVPLDSTHELGVSSASLTLQNPFVIEQGERTGLAVEELERSGPAVVQGTLLEPRYTSNTLVNAWPANERWMMDIRCTGPIIRDGVHAQLNCYLPGLFFTQAEPSPLSHGRSSLPIQFFAATPPVPPAGFVATAHQSALAIEIISDRATHLLLAA
jgi:hypothetical protein